MATREQINDLSGDDQMAYSDARRAYAQGVQRDLGRSANVNDFNTFDAQYQIPAPAAPANVASSSGFTEPPAVAQAIPDAPAIAANAIPPVPDVPSISDFGVNGAPSLDGFPVVSGSQKGFADTTPPVETGISGSDSRLHIVRSRAAKTLYDNNGKDTYTSDRGVITTMKILPGPGYDPLTAVKGARSNVDEDINALVAGRFINFFITDVQTSFNEKMQIIQTFGDNEVVYYFGKQPIIMNISGLLFDSLENDWFSKFLTTYAGVLRGTQLAQSFSLVKITFPNMVVTGSISGLSFNQNSQRDTDIPFQMQFVAKELIPLPVPIVKGAAKNLTGTLIDWKANRQGVQGYTLSSGGLGGGFMDSALKTVGAIDMGDALGVFKNNAADVSATINNIRTNIFSPVFGVISSITKIVKTTTGSIASIISSFTNPVNQVLRDITSIATQASGLALLVENSINSVLAIPARTITNAQNTIRALKSTAGTITRVPENISETFKRLYGTGRVKQGSAILSSGKARQKSKSAVLTSGAPYVPNKSNTI